MDIFYITVLNYSLLLQVTVTAFQYRTEPFVYYVRCSTYSFYQTVLWIRICYNADSNPAFYLNADPDPGGQINAVPSGSGSLSDLAVRKIAFLHEKYTLLM
jgi:hypothetical protein